MTDHSPVRFKATIPLPGRPWSATTACTVHLCTSHSLLTGLARHRPTNYIHHHTTDHKNNQCTSDTASAPSIIIACSHTWHFLIICLSGWYLCIHVPVLLCICSSSLLPRCAGIVQTAPNDSVARPRSRDPTLTQNLERWDTGLGTTQTSCHQTTPTQERQDNTQVGIADTPNALSVRPTITDQMCRVSALCDAALARLPSRSRLSILVGRFPRPGVPLHMKRRVSPSRGTVHSAAIPDLRPLRVQICPSLLVRYECSTVCARPSRSRTLHARHHDTSLMRWTWRGSALEALGVRPQALVGARRVQADEVPYLCLLEVVLQAQAGRRAGVVDQVEWAVGMLSAVGVLPEALGGLYAELRGVSYAPPPLLLIKRCTGYLQTGHSRTCCSGRSGPLPSPQRCRTRTRRRGRCYTRSSHTP